MTTKTIEAAAAIVREATEGDISSTDAATRILAMQPASPRPTGDVVEASPLLQVERVTRALDKAVDDAMGVMQQIAALATLQPADPGKTWLAEIAAKNSERVSTMPKCIASQPFSSDPDGWEALAAEDAIATLRASDPSRELVEAGRALLAKLDEAHPVSARRPTIAELEAMLAAPGGSVEVKPDGSIYTAPRDEIEALRAALAQGQSR